MKKRFLERVYSNDFPNRNDVIRVDVLSIDKDQLIKVKILSTNSPHKQGAVFAITAGTGYIEHKGKRSKGIGLWEDTTPKEIVIKCHSVPKLLTIYNMYEREDGSILNHMFKSGMLVEEIEGKRIYHCNDVGETDTFDSLVFSVEKM